MSPGGGPVSGGAGDLPSARPGPAAAAGGGVRGPAGAADGTRVRDPGRRAKILDAAAELFARSGYHSVSLADIGAAAGIVGSGIYRHFGSKAAILAALLDGVMDRLLENAGTALASGQGDGEVLAALVADHAALAIDNRYLVQLYQRELPTLPESGQRRLRQRQRLYIEEWVRVLTGIAPGITDAEARARVHAAIGAIQSVATYRSSLPRDQLLALLAGIAGACLRAGPAGAPSQDGPAG